MTVVFVNMEHAADLSDAGPVDGPHRIKHRPLALGDAVTGADGSASRILIRDTWNTANVDGLAPQTGDIVMSKHRYSAFYETRLDEILRSRGVTHLLVTGCTTSVCVDSTVRMRRSATTRASFSRIAPPSRSGRTRRR